MRQEAVKLVQWRNGFRLRTNSRCMEADSKSLHASLELLRKHYDARYPSVPALIPLPAASDVAFWETQEWIVDNLIRPQQASQERLAVKHAAEPENCELGCVAWRKAFWKRIIGHIEEGIAASSDPDV